MPKKKDENPRSRKFLIELYPDNAEHMKAYDKLNKAYNIVGILHNRDVYDKERKNEAGEVVNAIGELKKEHYHIILSFDNQRFLNPVAKELGIASRFVEKVGSYKTVCRYLIHLDDEDKAQYSLDELFGSPDMIADVKKFCNEEQSLTNIAIELMQIIDNTDAYFSEGKLFAKVCELGYCRYYNSLQRGLNAYLCDHNDLYTNSKKTDFRLVKRDNEVIS